MKESKAIVSDPSGKDSKLQELEKKAAEVVNNAEYLEVPDYGDGVQEELVTVSQELINELDEILMSLAEEKWIN